MIQLQSFDSPILLISIFVWIIVFICYLCFQKWLNSTIIHSMDISGFIKYITPNNTDADFEPWNTKTSLEILKNVRFGKFILFILIFIFITLFTLFIVYNLILGGNSENNPKVYGIICSCFFSIVLTTFALLEFVPYLVDIFENTLGYLYITTTRIVDTSFFNNKCIGSEFNISGENNVSYNFLISIMSLFNMNNFIKQLYDTTATATATDTATDTNKTFSIKFTTDHKEDDTAVVVTKLERLAHLIFLKHSVGHFVWIYFASLICVFTSIQGFSYYIHN